MFRLPIKLDIKRDIWGRSFDVSATSPSIESQSRSFYRIEAA
jgi:hypothetical protein